MVRMVRVVRALVHELIKTLIPLIPRMFHHFYGKHSWDKSVSCFLSLSPQLLIFIHTDFTDFICKALVLPIRVISVIRGFIYFLSILVPQISQISQILSVRSLSYLSVSSVSSVFFYLPSILVPQISQISQILSV